MKTRRSYTCASQRSSGGLPVRGRSALWRTDGAELAAAFRAWPGIRSVSVGRHSRTTPRRHDFAGSSNKVSKAGYSNAEPTMTRLSFQRPSSARKSQIVPPAPLDVLRALHTQVYPPSIGSETPVIIEAPSPSRNTIGDAISSSVAQRPSGIASRKGGPTSERPQYQADIGVITTVGLTLLTRMPYRPSSSAETRVMLSSAAFEEP
jgi:hypothetical protein